MCFVPSEVLTRELAQAGSGGGAPSEARSTPCLVHHWNLDTPCVLLAIATGFFAVASLPGRLEREFHQGAALGLVVRPVVRRGDYRLETWSSLFLSHQPVGHVCEAVGGLDLHSPL